MFCWTLSLRPPPWVVDHAVVSVGQRLYTFGGDVDPNANSSPKHLYTFNAVALRWAKLPEVTTGRPTGRIGHSAVLVEDIVYVWGNGFRADKRLYAFHVDDLRWLKTEVSGSVPEARGYHAACALGKVMYVHGGRRSRDFGLTNDTYKLDTATMVWSSVNTGGSPPPATERHSATVIGTKVFVFGGRTGREAMDCRSDVRVFDTETNLWLSGTSSAEGHPERGDHAAFAHDGELYVFCVVNGIFKGLWKFNTKTFSWKKVKPMGRGQVRRPFNRISGMQCHMVGDRALLFCRGIHILDLNPTLKTFCKMAVVWHGLEQSQLPHNLKWELAAMTSGGNWVPAINDGELVTKWMPYRNPYQ